MRTGIYVYGNPVSFKLRTEYKSVLMFVNPDAELVIKVTQGSVTLNQGIYKLVTNKPTEIRPVDGSVGDADIVVVTNNKDPWPDPPAKFTKTFPEVAPKSLQGFLPQADGVGPSKRPARPKAKAKTKAPSGDDK